MTCIIRLYSQDSALRTLHLPRLGRQLADHLDSESGMLWVRIPLELLIRGSVNGRPPGFEPDSEGSNPSPRTCPDGVMESTSASEADRLGSNPGRDTVSLRCTGRISLYESEGPGSIPGRDTENA